MRHGANDIYLFGIIQVNTQLLGISQTAINLKVNGHMSYTGLGGHENKLSGGVIAFCVHYHIFGSKGFYRKNMRSIQTEHILGTILARRIQREFLVVQTIDTDSFSYRCFLFCS